MSKEIESKLGLDDKLTMDEVDQFLGVSHIQKRILPNKHYNVIIDLSEDRLYILTKTESDRNGKTIFKVAKVYIWSRIIEVLLYDGVWLW